MKLKLVLASMFVTLSLLGQNPTRATQISGANNIELEQIYKADQAERSGAGKPGMDAQGRDRERFNRVSALLDSGKVQTADDYFHAAQVYNHGAAPEHYLRAHVLATLAAAKGNKPALFLCAASLDRFLREIGRPQVFGTQYSRRGNDPTMEPYDRSMSDSLRAQFDVPTLKAQEALLLKANKTAKPK